MHELTEIQEQVNRIIAENRRLRSTSAFSVLLALAGICFAWSQGTVNIQSNLSASVMDENREVAKQLTHEQLKVKELLVVNDQGTTVWSVGSQPEGGSMTLFDKRGKQMWKAVADEHGGDMTIYSVSGQLVMKSHATEQGGEFSIYSEEGEIVATAAAADRGGKLVVNDSDGNLMWDTSVDVGGGKTSVYHRGGVAAWQAEATGGGGRVVVRNGEGDVAWRMSGGVDKKFGNFLGGLAGQPEDPSLILFGENKKPVWSAFSTELGGTQTIHHNDGSIASLSGINKFGGVCRLFNNEGKFNCEVACGEEGGVFAAGNKAGEILFIAGAYNDGGNLRTLNPQGVTSCELSTIDDGGEMLIYNKDGETSVIARSGEEGGYMKIQNHQSPVHWYASAPNSGAETGILNALFRKLWSVDSIADGTAGQVAVYHSESKGVCTMYADKDGGIFYLTNKNGKHAWNVFVQKDGIGYVGGNDGK